MVPVALRLLGKYLSPNLQEQICLVSGVLRAETSIVLLLMGKKIPEQAGLVNPVGEAAASTGQAKITIITIKESTQQQHIYFWGEQKSDSE